MVHQHVTGSLSVLLQRPAHYSPHCPLLGLGILRVAAAFTKEKKKKKKEDSSCILLCSCYLSIVPLHPATMVCLGWWFLGCAGPHHLSHLQPPVPITYMYTCGSGRTWTLPHTHTHTHLVAVLGDVEAGFLLCMAWACCTPALWTKARPVPFCV